MASAKKLVGTCFGRFDLIHYGHINLFRWCKSQVDVLLVGVASDDYCKQFNPVKNKWRDRAEVVRAIQCVDGVYCHESENPMKLWYETQAADIMFLQAEQKDDPVYCASLKELLDKEPQVRIIWNPRTPNVSVKAIRKKDR